MELPRPPRRSRVKVQMRARERTTLAARPVQRDVRRIMASLPQGLCFDERKRKQKTGGRGRIGVWGILVRDRRQMVHHAFIVD